jgi:MFS family permease
MTTAGGGEDASGGLRRLASAGRALRSRNYRLFFFGQLVSLTGNWMTQIAMSWLVYRLTRSSVQLGLVTFAGQIPSFLLAPVAGVLVDRWDLRRTLIATQVLAMLQSFALAYFTLKGSVTIHHVMVLYLIQGVINGVDIPARQTIVSQLVTDPSDIGNAIALNSSIFNLARLIGPSIAGFVIAAAGEGVCFMSDGVSYIAAIAAMYFIRIAPREHVARSTTVMRDLRDGLNYALGFPPIREMLILCAIVSLLGIPYTVLMPVFASDLLHGGPQTLGFLMGGIGIGAVAGALLLASRRTVVGLGRWIVMTGLGFSAVIIIFALSRAVWLSVIMMLFTGFCLVIVNAAANTLVQTLADPDKRGRVLSLLMMCYLGMVPIGGLLFGALARVERIGPRGTVIFGGLCCAIAVIRFARKLPEIRKHARPVLVERGILPPIAEGLENVGELSVPPQNVT